MSKCQTSKLSKTFVGGAVCREFQSEASATEEMLDRVVCSREQFSRLTVCSVVWPGCWLWQTEAHHDDLLTQWWADTVHCTDWKWRTTTVYRTPPAEYIRVSEKKLCVLFF